MKVVERLVVRLIRDGAIEEEDREIYEYGFYHGIIVLVNLLCTLLIGLCMGMLLEVVFFMIAYIPLRTYSGGFHAKTQLRCFIYSNLLVVAILGAAHFLSGYLFLLVAMGLIGAGIITFLAPVEDQNKPLDAAEVLEYGKKARRILVLDVVLAGILKFFSFESGVATIMISIFALGLFLIMGYIKNIRLKGGRKEDE